MNDIIFDNLNKIIILWVIVGLISTVYSASLGPEHMSRARVMVLSVIMLPIALFILFVVVYSAIINAVINRIKGSR